MAYEKAINTAPRSLVYFLTCADCGLVFTSPSIQRKRCDRPECKNKGACKRCGCAIVRSTRHQRLCAPCEAIQRVETQEKKRRAKKRHRKEGLDFRGKNRKRAKHYGVEYEPISLAKVLERDGFKCGICRKRIDPELAVPHPKSPTLDHIVPMSRGGAHLYSNVQAAHFMCNSIKGAGSAGEQLLLVG